MAYIASKNKGGQKTAWRIYKIAAKPADKGI